MYQLFNLKPFFSSLKSIQIKMLSKILHNAAQTPEKEAVVYQNKVLSYRVLAYEVYRRAAFLQQKYSHKKYLLAHSDSLENLLNLLALMALGRVGIIAPRHLLTEQYESILQENDAQLLDFEIDADFNSKEFKIKETKFSDYFLGVLTSGTTGNPKIIWKDYQSWVSAFQHQSDVFKITENDRLFVLDALGYSANLNSALHILWQGGTLIMTTLQSATQWTKQIEQQAVSSVFLVPSHYRLLLKSAEKIPQIKSLVSAGEKLDYKTAKALMQICPNACLTEYYGAAELGHISFHQNQDILDFGYSVGKAFPEVKISIINQEISVESPYISPDYRGKKTVHDLGYFEQGRLVILGRTGRMFNRRGLNVFAEEIENCVQELDFINEVAAIGQLREDGSHDIYLVYSVYTDFTKSEEYPRLIKQYLLEKLPPAKHPKRIIALENLPHKDHGKIDYQAIARTLPQPTPLPLTPEGRL